MGENSSRYRELEKRSTECAKAVIRLCLKLPKGSVTNPLITQIIRSSGSIGANFREANEALSKKDFLHRMKITRKETKETRHWLELIEVAVPEVSAEIARINREVDELRSIFSAIIDKSRG
jgi:four helix bundle protein